jgi:ssDNA-binding Zn-finger/Zn-ribbon topoisomerase 1
MSFFVKCDKCGKIGETRSEYGHFESYMEIKRGWKELFQHIHLCPKCKSPYWDRPRRRR